MSIYKRMAAIALTTCVLATTAAQAAYPDHQIRLIVPFGAGGITDLVARHIGQALGEQLKQSVIVENRPGAGGVIAAQVAATTAPDGYTLFMGTVGTQIVNPLIMNKLSYDPVRSFKPVGLVGAAPNVLAVRSTLSVNSYDELIAYAKENPGKLNFGSAGTASSPHLALELLKLNANVDITHVPFKSGSEAVNAAIGGQVDVVMDAIPVVMPYVNSGRLKALFLGIDRPVKGAEKVPNLKTVPGGPDVSSWSAFYVPAQTPDATIEVLNGALQKALADPQVQARLADQGILLYSGTLDEYAAFMAAERERWTTVVKKADIHLN